MSDLLAAKTYSNNINFEDFLFWEVLLVIISLGFIVSMYIGPNMSVLTSPYLPPSWVVTLLWTSMYLLLGLTCYTGIKSDPSNVVFVVLMSIGLLLYVSWCFVVYSLKLIKDGFIIIIFLDIVFLLQCLYLLSLPNNQSAKITGGMLLIFFIWIVYLTVINYLCI